MIKQTKKTPEKKTRKRVHAAYCNGRLKIRWSGKRCDCGARWVCY